MLKIVIGVLIIGIVSVGGFLYYQSVQDKLANPPKDTEITKTEDEVTPSPTPEKEASIDEYAIEVQNGSGIAGQAGIVQGILEDGGYVVDGTANADNYDYEKTVIQAKEGVSKAWISKLKKLLKKNYEVKSRVEDLDADADTDVVIIVGSLDDNGEALGVSTSVSEESESADTKSSDTSGEATTLTPTVEVSGTETLTPSPAEGA